MKPPSLTRARKLAGLAGRAAWVRALRHGCAAATEHRDVVALSGMGTLLDVGANVGQFSVLVRGLMPHVRIHAFEPLEAAAGTFAEVFEGDASTTLHRCALGAASGAHDMHVSNRADSSSLLEIGSGQTSAFPGTEAVGTETIRVATLAERVDVVSLPGPVFMKIDVQGYELEVLRGCEAVLDGIDAVYVECSFQELYVGQPDANEVLHWLAERGFALAGVHNTTYGSDGACVQSDMLFERVTDRSASR